MPGYESLQSGELLTVVLFVWLVAGRVSRGGRLLCTYRRIQRTRRHRCSGLCQGYKKWVGGEARVLCAKCTRGWRREDTSATFWTSQKLLNRAGRSGLASALFHGVMNFDRAHFHICEIGEDRLRTSRQSRKDIQGDFYIVELADDVSAHDDYQ